MRRPWMLAGLPGRTKPRLIKLNPLLLGSGIPLVTRLQGVQSLALLSTKVYANGVLLLRYAVMPGGAAGTNAVAPPAL